MLKIKINLIKKIGNLRFHQELANAIELINVTNRLKTMSRFPPAVIVGCRPPIARIDIPKAFKRREISRNASRALSKL